MAKNVNSEKVEGAGLFSAGLVAIGAVAAFAPIGAIGSISQGELGILLEKEGVK